MNDYSQPDFYRFNQDSLIFAQWLKTHVKEARKILDMGAGCGVIGLELSQKFRPEKLTLVELQDEFKTHLEKNAQFFCPKETSVDIIISAIGDFNGPSHYDLVVCNPPYYLAGKGELPSDSRKALARSFICDGWEVLVKKMKEHLSEDGRAFIVLKHDLAHLKEIRTLVGNHDLVDYQNVKILELTLHKD